MKEEVNHAAGRLLFLLDYAIFPGPTSGCFNCCLGLRERVLVSIWRPNVLSRQNGKAGRGVYTGVGDVQLLPLCWYMLSSVCERRGGEIERPCAYY